MSLATQEMIVIAAIAKIGAIVYMIFHLFAILLITRQIMIASRMVRTKLRSSLLLLTLIHAILLFIVLLITVFIDPLK